MSKVNLEILAYEPSPLGLLCLRRREVLARPGTFVTEVTLNHEFLMSSYNTDSERAISNRAVELHEGSQLTALVGGLGLGYTARSALLDERVRSMKVIDALAEVIDWHRRHLVPLGAELTSDPRCELVHGDFFAMVAEGIEQTDDGPRQFDAILVDIDHTPRHLLNPSHAGFYEPTGLRRVAEQLRPAGVFALWSDDPPDDEFVAVMLPEFASVQAHVVTFPNHYTGEHSSCTVYVAVTPA